MLESTAANGLIEKQHPRLTHERAGEGHALCLTAGDARGAAVQQVLKAEHARDFLDPRAALGAAQMAYAIGNVLRDGQMRE